MYAKIIGTGSYLPEKSYTNAELAAWKNIDTTDEWIQSRTGIKQRHIAEPGQTSSDLAFEASRNALHAAGISADQIDLIIVATSTPDFVFPSTACLLQSKLGIKNCAAFDVQAVCSGFVYALTTAEKFIRSGSHKRALVVGAEVFSRIMNWEDRGTCVLFGDGAGAVVLAASETPGILSSVLRADGSYSGILSVPGNVNSGVIEGKAFLQMDGHAVFRFAVKVLEEVAAEALAEAQLTPAEIDWLVPHQANIRIMHASAKKLGINLDKVIVTVDQHGNTSAASIPLALDVAVKDGRIKPGHTVMFEGVGGGFTWGALIARM